MESPEELEKALARLMPSAISEKGQRSMDDLIDSLAAGETVASPLPVKKTGHGAWFGGLGAAAAAVVIAFSLPQREVSTVVEKPVPTEAIPSDRGVVLIGQSEVVEEAVPEDWMAETDGIPHRAFRVRVLDQERLRDVETGFEVLVSRPREEVRLMPVTSF